MNREKALWFAAGAAVSATATISASVLVPRTEPDVAFLVLKEPSEEPRPPDVPLPGDDYYGMIAAKTGELLRNCGATRFEAAAGGIDTSPYAWLPLTSDNAKSFPCVLMKGAEQGFLMNIDFRTDSTQ